jgi:hypothetical protein
MIAEQVAQAATFALLQAEGVEERRLNSLPAGA